MAKEIQRKFLDGHGAVVVYIEDDNGIVAPHTIYLFKTEPCPHCGDKPVDAESTGVDVDAVVAQIISDTDAYTAKLTAAKQQWSKNV